MRFSLCMIVKNEAAVLRDCLDSLKGLMDEMIIVDTGSVDDTKAIAAEYTPHVYDYEWQDDFAAARNFAFSKATGDYVYSADADEVLDAGNQERLRRLKAVLLPEVEIVQMIYVTQQPHHPTENFARDLRPKLFKRLREFTWIEPIHETVNLNPVVFDSDIEIQHRPQGDHSGRDFGVFERIIGEKGMLSDRLLGMYLRELYKAGTKAALENAAGFLEEALAAAAERGDALQCRRIIAVLIKYYRLSGQTADILRLSLREEVTVPSAEVCLELGYFFSENTAPAEASAWFYRAAFACESELDVASSGVLALAALAESCRILGRTQEAAEYARMAEEWAPPVIV